MKEIDTLYAVKNVAENKYISAKASGGYLYTREKDAENKARAYNESAKFDKYAVAIIKLVEVPSETIRQKDKKYCYIACNRANVTMQRPKVPYKMYEIREVEVKTVI